MDPAAFAVDERWRASEQHSVQQLAPLFRLPGPEYRAHWTNGPVRYACLDCMQVMSLGQVAWQAFVFDDEGKLIDHNQLWAREDFIPLRLLSIAPLRVGFGPRASHVVEQETKFSLTAEQWQQYMKDADAKFQSSAQPKRDERQAN